MNAETVSKYDQIIENMFTTFMAVPTNRLSRSSAFRQYYWRFLEENGAYFNDELKEQIIEIAKTPTSKMGKELCRYSKDT